jgi:hypothetical protein
VERRKVNLPSDAHSSWLVWLARHETHDVASQQRSIRYRRCYKDETVHPHGEESLHRPIRRLVLMLLTVESRVGGTLSLP